MVKYTLSKSCYQQDLQYLRGASKADFEYLKNHIRRSRPMGLKQQMQHFLNRVEEDKKRAEVAV